MRMVRLALTVLFILGGVTVGSAATAGQGDRRGLIEQALDEPARITLENVRLGDAVEKLTEQTGSAYSCRQR